MSKEQSNNLASLVANVSTTVGSKDTNKSVGVRGTKINEFLTDQFVRTQRTGINRVTGLKAPASSAQRCRQHRSAKLQVINEQRRSGELQKLIEDLTARVATLEDIVS
jgi:hypothetical protein